MVVTQPGFIHWNGERYRENVGPGLLPDLYPVGRLATAGVPLAFSSDSPVIDPNPWPGIAGAVWRHTREGRPLPEREEASQRIPVLDAISCYTRSGATSEGTGVLEGKIKGRDGGGYGAGRPGPVGSGSCGPAGVKNSVDDGGRAGPVRELALAARHQR